MTSIKKIPKKIRARFRLASRGMSRQGVAKKTHIPLSTVKWFMKDNWNNPSLEMIVRVEKLCRGLGFSLRDII